jgi:hypothetical protein
MGSTVPGEVEFSLGIGERHVGREMDSRVR